MSGHDWHPVAGRRRVEVCPRCRMTRITVGRGRRRRTRYRSAEGLALVASRRWWPFSQADEQRAIAIDRVFEKGGDDG